MDKIKYNAYKHRETGLQIKAIQFKEGMEDGRLKNGKYYINGWDSGFEKPLSIDEDYFIVLRKKYRFIFEKNWFLKVYKKVKL